MTVNTFVFWWNIGVFVVIVCVLLAAACNDNGPRSS